MNAELPMDVTLAGIVIELSGVHAKADSPIVSSELGEANVTELRDSDCPNALFPIDVTLAGNWILESELAF